MTAENKTITELDAGTTIGGTEVIAGVQSAITVKFTMTQVKTWTSASPTLVTPVLGVATATSINGLTITSSTGTVTIANGKTLTVSNILTLAGTDSTVMTFPGTSATVARADAAQTFAGIQTFTASPILFVNAAPADGALAANQCAIWFDPTNGAAAVMFKAKQADGTVKTGTVAVTT